MVKVPSPAGEPLLRRPLGYLARDAAAGRLSLLVQKVGRGTEMLARVRPGEELAVLGPLGRGWTLPEQGPVLLVAGGIGIVPLYDLACISAPRLEVTLIYGARCGEELHAREALAGLPLELILATDDGSCGMCGTSLHVLPRLTLGRFKSYFACGPAPMLAGLQKTMAAAGVPGELSLEERMACGFGACLGCAVRIRGAGGEPVHRRVCADGPVFPAAEVILDA